MSDAKHQILPPIVNAIKTQEEIDAHTAMISLDAEIIERFRTAIEIGKWADGTPLTPAQRETCLQTVLVWENAHLPVTERIGYIHRDIDEQGRKVGAECDIEHEHHYPNLPNPARDAKKALETPVTIRPS